VGSWAACRRARRITALRDSPFTGGSMTALARQYLLVVAIAVQPLLLLLSLVLLLALGRLSRALCAWLLLRVIAVAGCGSPASFLLAGITPAMCMSRDYLVCTTHFVGTV
jgi:hypothetical protein